MAKPSETGMEALHHLKSTDPPALLAPSPTLSQTARTASQHLFSCLKPYAPKSPFDQLLTDGFDAEQIWQQIDLLSQPLLSTLRRQVKHLEKHPEESKIVLKKENEFLDGERKILEEKETKRFDDDVDDDDMDMDMDEFDDEEEEEEGGRRESEKGESEDESGEMVEGKGGEGIEDKFLKIKELEEYLEEDEAREYGLDRKKKKGELKLEEEEEEEEEEEDEEEEDDDDDELDDEYEDAEENASFRYEDFFGAKKKTVPKRKSSLSNGSDEDSGLNDDGAVEKKGGLSTHEKQLEKLQSEIEQMEKANLEPKTWTMRGEVTAASRPKNSALEVDLDFEHNVRPAPVITEEITASIEDMIKQRIIEGRFDDIQKVSSLPSTAPKEVKQLDENKSKKGLAEVYEEEYIQKTNPAAAPISFSDEQKKEASILFKKLCLKLDALSHFHFAPKPVIEDMSIQANVPALAMEEIAPTAVSDAAMLAPEEVFSGKGDIKEEAEVTQAERKRRRAKKKRKFKAEAVKRMTKKARDNTALLNHNEGE
ncbi:M phase phosphoprotein 10 isoform X2 [Hevea brasiliensis]|uniref:M phase phosphoprotein 10 isoform X2 n=1 Tax=Hevea brasiliensis TaxID=3981 RepID=UPI0025EFCC98|nr:M phase phosphoprotein 10 isoform X2 [Hevea brasiliensis]